MLSSASSNRVTAMNLSKQPVLALVDGEHDPEIGSLCRMKCTKFPHGMQLLGHCSA
jgi:hypothetical protein